MRVKMQNVSAHSQGGAILLLLTQPHTAFYSQAQKKDFVSLETF